jgi:hypothetical protein
MDVGLKTYESLCGVGHMQKICGFWEHSQCPHCNKDDKTTTHILLCSGNGATEEQLTRLVNLDQWLAEVDSHPLIHQCIIASLSGFPETPSFTQWMIKAYP